MREELQQYLNVPSYAHTSSENVNTENELTFGSTEYLDYEVENQDNNDTEANTTPNETNMSEGESEDGSGDSSEETVTTKKYKCRYMGCLYFSNDCSNRRRHESRCEHNPENKSKIVARAKHAQELPYKVTNGRYKCKKCSKHYSSSWGVMRHVSRDHTAEASLNNFDAEE